VVRFGFAVRRGGAGDAHSEYSTVSAHCDSMPLASAVPD
jgi:hypothetical protein